MSEQEEWPLTLAEWLVLCLVCEKPRHGFDIARVLGREGSMGQVWRVPKPVIYRALQRLEQLGLVRGAEQPSRQGPVRLLVDATQDGRDAAAAWLTRPVEHTRDVRSELLMKLALLDRAAADPQPLLEAQRELLVPVAAALQDRLGDARGFDRALLLWRYETASATVRFLDALREQAAAEAPAGRRGTGGQA